MSKKPKQVIIGPVVYDVTYANRIIDDESGKSINGVIYYQDTKIYISKDMDKQVTPFALMHESIHGMLEQAGHTDHSEEMVIALGYAIVRFMRDNPKFVKWVMESA